LTRSSRALRGEDRGDEEFEGRAMIEVDARVRVGAFEDPDGRKGRVIFPSVWRASSGRWLGVYGKNWRPFPICALESDDGIRWQPRPAPDVVPPAGNSRLLLVTWPCRASMCTSQIS
jgi:hypothetical protein